MPACFPLLLPASVDLLEALRNNDILGFLILFVLLALSVVSIMVIFLKYWEIGAARGQSRRFQRLVESDGTWESLFLASKKYPESPLARLLKETYKECRLENWFAGKKGLPLDHRLNLARESVGSILARVSSEEETRLMNWLTLLAVVSSLAPFLGLFGTVWGVLASFQAVGREGSAALSALAPGISTALMTTIFGLLAAIPALVAYNFFMREINKLSGAMEVFSHDIDNAVRKQILLEEDRS